MDHPCSPRAYAIAELFPQKAEAKTALLIFSNTSKGVPFTPTLNGQTAALASMPLTRCACQGTKCQPRYVIEGSRLQGNNSVSQSRTFWGWAVHPFSLKELHPLCLLSPFPARPVPQPRPRCEVGTRQGTWGCGLRGAGMKTASRGHMATKEGREGMQMRGLHWS